MAWVALRMLTGDRSKYLGLIFGVTFAALLGNSLSKSFFVAFETAMTRPALRTARPIIQRA